MSNMASVHCCSLLLMAPANAMAVIGSLQLELTHAMMQLRAFPAPGHTADRLRTRNPRPQQQKFVKDKDFTKHEKGKR